MTWPAAEVLVDESVVQALLADQFPELCHLRLRYAGEGFDNFLWRVGDSRVVRLPRRLRAVEPLENELRWLSSAAGRVSLATPLPLAAGAPSERFNWPWMVANWIDGEAGEDADEQSLLASAEPLATFLRELHVPAPSEAPHNPWRSVSLIERAADLEKRLHGLADELDAERVWVLFQRACVAPRPETLMWLHGDVHPGNAIFRDGHLVGVVDFGDLCAGDPATDLSGGLMTLAPESLGTFFSTYGVADESILYRVVGWAVVLGTMMVSLGRADRPFYTSIGQRALENAAYLSGEL